MPPRRSSNQPMLIAGAPVSPPSSSSPARGRARRRGRDASDDDDANSRSRSRSRERDRDRDRSRSRSSVRISNSDRVVMHARIVAAIGRCTDAVHLYYQKQQEQQRRDSIRHWITVALITLLLAQLCWVASSPPFVV